MNKEKLMGMLPDIIADLLRAVKAKFATRHIFYTDKKRFKRNYSRSIKKANLQQLEARLTFHSHSIEKGLSHTNIRLGFGKTALRKLATTMRAYNNASFTSSSKSYQNAISVIREYIVVHKKNNFNIDYLGQLFDPEILEEAERTKIDLGGTKTIKRSSKKNNSQKNFKELFNDRYSIREFDDTAVDKTKIDNAIQIATKSPSICNRQTSRVRVVMDKDLVEKVLKIQAGMDGYDLPPVVLAVTTDTRHYVALSERNQPYIDGGLFAMSLFLALEFEGLAACPLNAMFNTTRDKKMRKLLKTPEFENYIVFIAVGNFKKEVSVPKSFRYKAEEITAKYQ